MNLFPIIFENDEIILIHKKSGVPVQGGAGIKHSVDVDLAKQVSKKIFLVHRLDRDTEGILCVAKTQDAASKYTKLFSSKEIKKEYVALCFGKPVLNGKIVEKGDIDFAILKNGKSFSALSHFEVEKTIEKNIEIACAEQSEMSSKTEKITLSKIRVLIDTGRTHQIRIHLSKVGCPIVADDKHGNFKLNKLAKKYLKIKNLCLVAEKLTLPVDGKRKTFSLQKDCFSDIMLA